MGLLDSVIGNALTPKLKLPEFKSIDVGTEAGKAVANNQKNLAGIENLGSNVNKYNQSELNKQLQALIPNLDQINSNVSKTLASETAGELPADVQSAIERSGAARALSGGFGGSQRQGNLTSRDLGLTSLDLKTKGMDSAARWIASARSTQAAPMFDATSMFVNPALQLQSDTSERNAQFQHDYTDAQLKQSQSMGYAVAQGLKQDVSFVEGLATAAAGSLGKMGGI